MGSLLRVSKIWDLKSGFLKNKFEGVQIISFFLDVQYLNKKFLILLKSFLHPFKELWGFI